MSGGGLSTKGLAGGGGAGASYRMRAHDGTLGRLVFWTAITVDTGGAEYTGPGPLTDVVVQNIIGQEVEIIVIITGTGVETMPEQWTQQNVAANQTNIPLSAQVSTNFDTIKMMRNGSVVGMSTRLTQAITAGMLTVTLTKNGAPGTLSIPHTSGSGAIATQAAGIDTYVAGDLIGLTITTNAGFLPTTTDIEAWLEVVEAA